MMQERMYAALGATNEAILRTKDRNELFQRVCSAAVEAGGFRGALALLPNTEGWLQVAASAGAGTQQLPDLQISIDVNSERGNGLAGSAYRGGRTSVADDFKNDPRATPWLSMGVAQSVGAAAAVPLLCSGKSEGVFLFFMKEAGSLTPPLIELLERMVENVAFALEVFAHEEQRRRSERANRRLTDMLTALSATNTAIVRATTADEMFASVCKAISSSGKSLGAAAILLAQPDSHWLKLVAASGAGTDEIRKLELSIDAEHPRGQGLAGPAFREKRLVISYDLTSDARARDQYDRSRSPYGGAAVPLIVRGESVGVLYVFFARTSGRAEQGILKLLSDIGENVSFALEGFQRESERERYMRMFAALSATNEAIVRAKTPDELYNMVAEASVRGTRFTSASILLAQPGDKHFRTVAAAGPRAEIIKSRKYSPLEELPEGRGLTGTAFRSGQPCIRNDVPESERRPQWPYDNKGAGRSRSGVALPLTCRGEIVGVILLWPPRRKPSPPNLWICCGGWLKTYPLH